MGFNQRCCNILALVLTFFRLTKGCATYFRPETIVTSFLHLMLLFYKVIFNHTPDSFAIFLHFMMLLFKVLFNHTWKRPVLWCFIVIKQCICLRFHWLAENKNNVAKQFLILDLPFNLHY